MRFMWTYNRAVDIEGVLADRGHAYASKVIAYEGASHRVMVTGDEAFMDMINDDYADTVRYWTVTSCNKQYCTRYDDGVSTFMGCMKEVTYKAAVEHIGLDVTNWFLMDAKKQWIPVLENPNRLIPIAKLRGGLVSEMQAKQAEMLDMTQHMVDGLKANQRRRTVSGRFSAKQPNFVEIKRPWPLKSPMDLTTPWFDEYLRQQRLKCAYSEYEAAVETMQHKWRKYKELLDV